MRPGRFWSGLIAATFVFTSSGFIQAQQNTQSAVERALDLLEDNNARQAVAIAKANALAAALSRANASARTANASVSREMNRNFTDHGVRR